MLAANILHGMHLNGSPTLVFWGKNEHSLCNRHSDNFARLATNAESVGNLNPSVLKFCNMRCYAGREHSARYASERQPNSGLLG